jgi:hypothetical protein
LCKAGGWCSIEGLWRGYVDGILLDDGFGNRHEIVVKEEVICACRLREGVYRGVGVVVVVWHLVGCLAVLMWVNNARGRYPWREIKGHDRTEGVVTYSRYYITLNRRGFCRRRRRLY